MSQPNYKNITHFVQTVVQIKDTDGLLKPLNTKQLAQIAEFEKMQNQGYDLKLIKTRNGSKLCYINP